MPTYEYLCPRGHEFELFQKMSDKPRAKCPTCGKPATRQISGGAGLHFKGSGFYITDYGKDGKGPRKDAEKPAPAAEPAAAAKSDAKPDAKPEAKPSKVEKPAAAKSSSKKAAE